MNHLFTKSSVLTLLTVFALTGCGAMHDGADIGFKIGQGKGLMKMKKFAQADVDFDEALAKIDKDETDKTLPATLASSFRAHVFALKAILYAKQDKKEDALTYFEKSKQLFEGQTKLSRIAKEHFQECLLAYADMLRSENKKEEAAKLDEQRTRL